MGRFSKIKSVKVKKPKTPTKVKARIGKKSRSRIKPLKNPHMDWSKGYPRVRSRPLKNPHVDAQAEAYRHAFDIASPEELLEKYGGRTPKTPAQLRKEQRSRTRAKQRITFRGKPIKFVK